MFPTVTTLLIAAFFESAFCGIPRSHTVPYYCASVKCPRLYCNAQITPPGKCCPECTAVPDPCAGIGGCLAIWCEGQYTPPGECCPVCPCYYKGSVYKSGDHFMDDCNNCTCGFSGDVACTEKACGGSGSSCTYKGNRYNNGAVFKDDCQTCLCLFGTVSCSGNVCQDEKPGQCPPNDPNATTICPVQCQGDNTCPGNQKCCQYGCMISCTDPVFFGPCSVKLAEWEAQYDAANGRPLGLERPRCDSRGDFMGMQYRGSQAFCVAPDGTEIAGFKVNRWEAVDMDCKCARDMYAYQQSGAIGRMFSCDRFGNYSPVGCTGSVCYCQDRRGNRIGDTTVNIGDSDSLNC